MVALMADPVVVGEQALQIPAELSEFPCPHGAKPQRTETAEGVTWMCLDAHGRPQGFAVVWAGKERLARVTTYVDGRRQGLQWLFYAGGAPKERGLWMNDALVRVTRWYPSGARKEEGEL